MADSWDHSWGGQPAHLPVASARARGFSEHVSGVPRRSEHSERQGAEASLKGFTPTASVASATSQWSQQSWGPPRFKGVERQTPSLQWGDTVQLVIASQYGRHR